MDILTEYGKKEDLHEDLIPYICEYDFLGQCLKHPIVFSVPYHKEMNSILNRQYEAKKGALDKYISNEKYGGYVFLHERPYRINAFMDISHKLSDQEYWKILGEIYIDSENIYENLYDWEDLLTEDIDQSHFFMEDNERKEFENIPEEITIYRGYKHPEAKFGFSWTTDIKIAKFFANRLVKDYEEPLIAEYKIKKKDVFAYKTGRSESEIIVIDAENKVF